MAPINPAGKMVSLGFSFDEKGISLTSASIGSVPAMGAGLPKDVIDNGGLAPGVTLGLGAVAAIGTHLLVQVIGKRDAAYTAKDAALDGLSGMALSTCFIGGPQAEAVCMGAVSSVPLAIIDKIKDPSWDFRYGLLTQGALRLGVELVGGNPMPFTGWRPTSTGVALQTGELLANAATDIGFDTLQFAAGNASSAALQRWIAGRSADDALSFGLIGAAYGGTESLALNLFMGAPYKADPALVERGVAAVAASGGVDVSDMVAHTRWRTGGLVLSFGMDAITLPGNVTVHPDHVGDASIYGHELVHRDQFAGGYGTTGPGLLRPGAGMLGAYGQYLWTATTLGYANDPFEREAYAYANGLTDYGANAPDHGGAPVGSILGAGLALGLYGLGVGTLH